ncbi:MAG: glucosaminidase domain-containing protein [Paludibacteraceae bacterium]|nr:glucosaminidase domain-containing protein [Paludibacteraceae bacterium]
MKKHVLTCLLAVAAVLAASAQKQNETYLAYIEKWKETALQNQADYGIPASIIMAQALLESGAGQSELALKAKNHFGIKCTGDWFGGVYYYDDERSGECFRQYRDAGESFKDHALFLQRPRYASCFEIAIEDYEGWAYRLRECGYATDKQYAPKLIKIIEDYGLAELAQESKAESRKSKDESQKSNAGSQKSKDRPLKATVVTRTEPIATFTHDPEPPYVAPPTAREERDSFFLSHPRYRQNGIVYVVARDEDTYANVAFRLNVRERDLREDNDALGLTLKKGDRIYLSSKRTTGANVYVWTHPGQTLWELSQEEGVQEDAIRRYNGLDNSVRKFTIRQKIYLRKVKDDAVR